MLGRLHILSQSYNLAKSMIQAIGDNKNRPRMRQLPLRTW